MTAIQLTHILSTSDGVPWLRCPPDRVLSYRLEPDAVVAEVQRGEAWRYEAGSEDSLIAGRWVSDVGAVGQRCTVLLGYRVVD